MIVGGKPELLAPAGNFERLKTAVLYGADAVYIGGKAYGLRAAAGFDVEEMKRGIEFAHSYGKKVYITLNIFAHNEELVDFADSARKLADFGADAFIVSDTGLLQILRETLPNAAIHISTQANVTNYRAARFFYDMGARRVVFSRELTLAEIAEIRRNVPEDMVIECFVHGATCLSYSGRCYLSQYMNGRDANRGGCSQPCRWRYALMEEKREGEYFPVYEDENGAYILNSKDLRMVEHVPELVAAGVGSFKIEGRMKSEYYVASTVKAYRSAIDDYFDNPEAYNGNVERYIAETEKSSHRQYSTGFYFRDKSTPETGQNQDSAQYIRGYEYVALVQAYDAQTRLSTVVQRNKFSIGEELEVLVHNGDGFSFTLTEMYDESGEAVTSAPHPEQVLKIRVPKKVHGYDIIRRAQC